MLDELPRGLVGALAECLEGPLLGLGGPKAGLGGERSACQLVLGEEVDVRFAVAHYITYIFSINSNSPTSVVFMFLVALFVILFFAQAVWEARKHRIDRHLDAVVFAMIFLSLPASGRLIEAVMRLLGVDNTRALDLVSVGFGYQVAVVDLTILMVAAVPILLWGLYAVPRAVPRKNPAKLSIATLFFVLPLLAIIAQSVAR